MTAILALIQQPALYSGLLLNGALTRLAGPSGGVRSTPKQMITQALLVTLNAVAPHFGILGRRPIEASMRSVEGLEEMYKDPLWYRSNIKVRTINSLNRGCVRVQAGACTIKAPIYAQHGTADMTCTLETIKHFLTLVSTPPSEVTLKEVEGGLHDLNHDPCTPEGYRLRTITLSPVGVVPNTALFWHHGFGEHAHRHEVLGQIAAAGFLVCLYDCYGHGASAPFQEHLRALIEDPQELVQDMVDYTHHVMDERIASGVPLVKLMAGGHSMGGMAAILTVIQQPFLYWGLMLSGALTQLQGPTGVRTSWTGFANRALLSSLNAVVPYYGLLGRKPIEGGMRCKDGVEALHQDTLIYRGPIKVRTIISLIRGCTSVTKHAHSVKIPIYAQHGNADATCSFESIQSFLSSVSTPPSEVTLKEVEGGLHDLHRDPCTPECLAAMIAWLQAQ
ncbi:MAG: hypothetical protein WDW38_010989 [Sanguina aurantia]